MVLSSRDLYLTITVSSQLTTSVTVSFAFHGDELHVLMILVVLLTQKNITHKRNQVLSGQMNATFASSFYLNKIFLFYHEGAVKIISSYFIV